jgi:hypothetical protein
MHSNERFSNLSLTRVIENRIKDYTHNLIVLNLFLILAKLILCNIS